MPLGRIQSAVFSRTPTYTPPSGGLLINFSIDNNDTLIRANPHAWSWQDRCYSHKQTAEPYRLFTRKMDSELTQSHRSATFGEAEVPSMQPNSTETTNSLAT